MGVWVEKKCDLGREYFIPLHMYKLFLLKVFLFQALHNNHDITITQDAEKRRFQT